MSLVARGLEAEGMATALVSVMPALSSPARPPRQVIRRLNIGATVGRPHDIDDQRETLVKMLSLIDSAESHGAVEKDAKKAE